MADASSLEGRRAWRWIPTLYFAEGIPYVVVMTVSVVLYKNLGISNTDIALYTSWLYLPWVIKPLWSPIVDLFGTKRRWIFGLQFVIGAALACVALTVPATRFFQLTLAVFWLMAFSSATHDIAADGFYMLALPSHLQAAFVGIRSTFYRLAMIAGQGGVVYLAGTLQARWGVAHAWSLVFFIVAAVFALAAAYHAWALPYPAADAPAGAASPGNAARGLWAEFIAVFAAFFRRRELTRVLGFLLLYRFAEAQLLKLVVPFLLDRRDVGGLGLSTQEVGIVYGTVGVVALTLGGIIGGVVVSRYGLKRLLWPMIVVMHLPNLVFVVLAWLQPQNVAIIGGSVAVEQFGYGFGFTAYLLYMILVADGPHRTAHYALCTGFMALGMMLPGMAAGWIADHLGYFRFFLYVCIATIPPFTAAALVRIPEEFGRKSTDGR